VVSRWGGREGIDHGPVGRRLLPRKLRDACVAVGDVGLECRRA